MAVDDRILFVHIPKTAGMSLYRALEQWAGPGASLRFAFGGQEDVERYRQLPRDRLKSLRLLSGHLGFRVFQAREVAEWLPITVLRDPVARVLSDYTYVMSTPAHPWHAELSGNRLSEVVDRWSEDLQWANQQCRMVCGEADAETAFDTLRTEYFLACALKDISLLIAALSTRLGCDLRLPRENISSERIDPKTVDPATLARIRDANREDLALLERVRKARLVGFGAADVVADVNRP